MIHRITMPIRAENRWLYPIDWPQVSRAIRFVRAGARCERCRRPHRRHVAHLGDGRRVALRGVALLAGVRTTYVVLACAHLDHDPGNNATANLAALCQRCHMLHDAAEHRWQRWWNAFRRRAIRDLFEDPQLTRRRLMRDQPPRRGVDTSRRRRREG
jgi:hypothetical protein